MDRLSQTTAKPFMCNPLARAVSTIIIKERRAAVTLMAGAALALTGCSGLKGLGLGEFPQFGAKPQPALEESAIVASFYSQTSIASLALSASKPETAKRRGYLPCSAAMVQGDSCLLQVVKVPGGARFSSTTTYRLPLEDAYSVRWNVFWDDDRDADRTSAQQADKAHSLWQLWIPTPYGRVHFELSEDVVLLQTLFGEK